MISRVIIRVKKKSSCRSRLREKFVSINYWWSIGRELLKQLEIEDTKLDGIINKNRVRPFENFHLLFIFG